MWHNCLATSSNLHSREIPILNQCLTCLHDDEDAQHIFRSCPLALDAWVGSPITVHPLDHLSLPLASWLELWIGKFLQEDGYWGSRLPQFISTLWAIWNTRNNHIFRQVQANLQTLKVHEEEGNRQHTSFIAADHSVARPPPAPNYDLPPGFHLTNIGRLQQGTADISIQIDGSGDKKSGLGGAAWVVSHQQLIIHRQGIFLYASSALQTEAVACLHATRWARSSSFASILINTYSALRSWRLRVLPTSRSDIP